MSNVRQISFKHTSGSVKLIPGIDQMDCFPKMRQVQKMEREAGQRIPTFEPVDHTVRVTLGNEDYHPLTEAEKKLPQRVQDQIEDERAQDYRDRVRANQRIRDVLKFYEGQGEIEILGEGEKTEIEAKMDGSIIADLSPIARADYEARGIPIPAQYLTRDLKTATKPKPAKVAPEKPADEE